MHRRHRQTNCWKDPRMPYWKSSLQWKSFVLSTLIWIRRAAPCLQQSFQAKLSIRPSSMFQTSCLCVVVLQKQHQFCMVRLQQLIDFEMVIRDWLGTHVNHCGRPWTNASTSWILNPNNYNSLVVASSLSEFKFACVSWIVRTPTLARKYHIETQPACGFKHMQYFLLMLKWGNGGREGSRRHRHRYIHRRRQLACVLLRWRYRGVVRTQLCVYVD